MSDERLIGRSERAGRWSAGFGVLAALLLLIPAPGVRADLVMQIANDTMAAPGGTGSFDVVLTNTSSADSAPINFFSVDLLVSNPAIQFTAADTSTAIPYLFNAIGDQGLLITTPDNLSGPPYSPFSSSEVAANDIAANDVYDNPQAQVIAGNQSFGLLHVGYSVASGASGAHDVTFNSDGTSLFTMDSNSIDSTPNGGPIAALGPSVVPEPSSLTVVAVAGGLMLLAARYSAKATLLVSARNSRKTGRRE